MLNNENKCDGAGRNKRWGILALFALSVGTATAGVTYENIALSGDAVPGIDAIDLYGYAFSTPVLNDAGTVAFRANVSGPTFTGSTGNWAVLAHASGSVELVAASQDPVPGSSSGEKFRLFGDLLGISSSGEVGFAAQIFGAPTSLSGLWASDGDVTREVSRIGGVSAPGIAGATLINTSWKSFSSDGTAFIHTGLAGTGIDGTNDIAFYKVDADGSYTLVARKGDPVPGSSDGSVIVSPQNRPYYLTSNSHIATSSADTATMALFTETPGGDRSSVVAKFDGDSLAVAWADIGTATDITSNAGGDFAATGYVSDAVEGTSASWLVTDRAGTLESPVITGDLLPTGGGQNGLAGSFIGVDINDSDAIVFSASLSDVSSPYGGLAKGLWLDDGQELSLIALEGETLSEITEGQPIAAIDTNSVVFNNSNQVAFKGSIANSGPGSDSGVWMLNKQGHQLEQILREGQAIDVGGGNTKNVAGFAFLDEGFNDRGELAVKVGFSDEYSAIIKVSSFYDETDMAQIDAETESVMLLDDTATGAGRVSLALEDVTFSGTSTSTEVSATYGTPEITTLAGEFDATEGWEDVETSLRLNGATTTLQQWDVDIAGLWDGLLAITLEYDESLLDPSQDEGLLGLWHYGSYGIDGAREWRLYNSVNQYSDFFAIDTAANTITIRLDNLSPMVMTYSQGATASTSVPVPPVAMLLSFAALFLGRGARRRG